MNKSVKKILIALLSILYLAILILLAGGCKQANHEYLEQIIPNNATVGVVGEKINVSQTFVAEDDFYGVYVLMANYGMTQYGWADVEIRNCDTQEVVYKDTLWYHTIDDNAFHCFGTDKAIEVDSPTRFEINIQSKTSLYQGVTIWCSDVDAYESGESSYAGQAQAGDWCFGLLQEEYGENFQWGMYLKRAMIITLLFVFLLAHLLVDVKQMYEFIYRKRVWIAIVLFVFCVLNKFHFSSVGMYESYIQPGEGTEYSVPVFGEANPIRSDEWLVTLPRLLSAEYSDFGKYNEIVRGVTATNLSSSGLYFNYSALAEPTEWGFYLLGSEYGVSYMWCFKMIFGYLFMFELCMILTKQNRLISLLGATLIWWSAFNMWWSIALWLLTGTAAVVFFYYFMKEDVRWKRLLYGLGIAVFGANFVVELYPAWQVPAGYIYLTILVWICILFKDKWKTFEWKDWTIGFGCIGFMASIIIAHLYNSKEYITAIMTTAYPGTRVDYGGFILPKLLGYLSATLSPFIEVGNASENACFYIVFPLGIILALIVLWKQRGKNLLIWMLMIPTILFLCYCSFPLPEMLAKMTLMTFSTTIRAADALGFVSALLLVIALAHMQETEKLKWYIAIPIAIACVYGAYWREVSVGRTGGFLLVITAFAVVSVILIVLLITEFNVKWNKVGAVLITIGVLVSGLCVHPLMTGLDTIYGRPVADAVSEIVEADSNGKWIATDSLVTPNYLITLGASTYNSTNYIPNMELWELFDPEKTNEFTYNRYAHIVVILTEEDTYMELIQADVVYLYLSYKDFEKLDISYVLSTQQMEDNTYFDVTELYNDCGMYIYKCEYTTK